MGQTLTLSAEDGHQLSAYRATPAGTPRGGLVVIQEIFGVNSHIKKVTDGWAADGYVALAPALFDRVERGVDIGYSAEDIQHGRELRGKISTRRQRARRARRRPRARAGRRSGSAWSAIAGAAPWPGSPRRASTACRPPWATTAAASPRPPSESPRCPVHAPLRRDRPGDPEGALGDGRGASTRSSPSTSIRPATASAATSAASYHEPSARLARERTLAFFRQHVG